MTPVTITIKLDVSEAFRDHLVSTIDSCSNKLDSVRDVLTVLRCYDNPDLDESVYPEIIISNGGIS